MKPSSRLLLLALLLCAPAAARARAPDKPVRAESAVPPGEPRLQLGLFDGTGRACGGQLKITPKRLSWSPPFSPCPPSTFTLAERRQKGEATRWVYRLVGAPKSCTYKVVVLEKVARPEARIAWNAYSFTSMKAYRADSNDQLSCYLVKLD
jgi:hypothetical protein